MNALRWFDPPERVLIADHEMGAVGFRERFSFALERDDVSARLGDRLGRNGRLELVLRDKARRQRLAVQHDAVKRPHPARPRTFMTVDPSPR